ncbi:ribonuclease P protein subunit p25-like protein [Ornithorhynchus anatinus]|uniref:ribonuclease P protein subunit p25-like protein n=1 Tax=Ornithorhynchus anatinus TaxID=9258 RepID=UPI0001555E84|nr:ribonuclease P protein subunit p25-like protein [Ornithorhynchus anatinus]
MENYQKARTVEQPWPPAFPGLPPGTVQMRVKDGSKIRNLMGYALGRLEAGGARAVLFSGSGRAVGKTVTCVEIAKRRVRGLHQLTRLLFRQTEEAWEPRRPDAGLDRLTVRRNLPAICVLLSKDPLDARQDGYQPPDPRPPPDTPDPSPPADTPAPLGPLGPPLSVGAGASPRTGEGRRAAAERTGLAALPLRRGPGRTPS